MCHTVQLLSFPLLSEDEHIAFRTFILIRQSTNSSCATVIISVDDNFVVVYCIYIICDCNLSTSIQKYRHMDACVHVFAHEVVDIFTV